MSIKAKLEYTLAEDHLPPHRLRIRVTHDYTYGFAANLMYFDKTASRVNELREEAERWLKHQQIWFSSYRESNQCIVFYFFEAHNAMLLKLHMSDLL